MRALEEIRSLKVELSAKEKSFLALPTARFDKDAQSFPP